MVEMGFGAQNIFDVLRVEAELAHIGEDCGRRLRQRAVDEHQPVARVDQCDAQPREADKIGVAKDFFGFRRRQPFRRS
jgi:hypothetical protein